jgi:hypothetical protein
MKILEMLFPKKKTESCVKIQYKIIDYNNGFYLCCRFCKNYSWGKWQRISQYEGLFDYYDVDLNTMRYSLSWDECVALKNRHFKFITNPPQPKETILETLTLTNK